MVNYSFYSNTKTIIDLNNEGVEFMSSEQFPPAVSSFRKALQTSRSFISNKLEQVIEYGSDEDTCLISLSSDDFSDDSSSSSSTSADHNNGEDFTYDGPIHVPTYCAHNTEMQRSDSLLPSIVTFNLALAHHMWAANIAEKDQERAKKKLKKAVELYKLTVQLQRNSENQREQRRAANTELFMSSCLKTLDTFVINPVEKFAPPNTIVIKSNRRNNKCVAKKIKKLIIRT